jgi:hypothetical protein
MEAVVGQITVVESVGDSFNIALQRCWKAISIRRMTNLMLIILCAGEPPSTEYDTRKKVHLLQRTTSIMSPGTLLYQLERPNK